jgi:TatA/E family protein of Tat protein translocase
VFGIGSTELLIIGVFAFIIFGPDKVPELARTVGKFWKQFNEVREGMEKTIRMEMYAKDSDTEFGPTSPASAAEAVSSLPQVVAVDADDSEEEDEE